MQVTLCISLKLQVLQVNSAPPFWYLTCTKQSFNFWCQMWHELNPVRTEAQNNAKWAEAISSFHRWEGVPWCFSCFLLVLPSTVHIVFIAHRCQTSFGCSFPHILPGNEIPAFLFCQDKQGNVQWSLNWPCQNDRDAVNTSYYILQALCCHADNEIIF